jgi:hypothetical protein
MKKGLFITLGFIIVLLAAAMFIPRVQEKSVSLTVSCPSVAVTRQISSMGNWEKWWPGKKISDSSWELEQKTFDVTSMLLNGFQLLSEDKRIAIDLQFTPLNKNETSFTLRTATVLPFHPVYRLWNWLNGGYANRASSHLLNGCRDFFSAPSKVYGLDIKNGKVKYFSWISTKDNFDHSPSTEEIYGLADALQEYIKSNAANALGDPIMHIYRESNSSFELMVAIPTDRDLPSKDRFQLKNMILGSLLTAEVKGGVYTVGEAEKQLENYVRDYQIVSPAIPFQTLVTDRRKEMDTARWVSIVNYPVFN